MMTLEEIKKELRVLEHNTSVYKLEDWQVRQAIQVLSKVLREVVEHIDENDARITRAFNP